MRRQAAARRRGAALGVFMAGVAAWLALLWLMNRRPPDALGQLLFLALFALAVTFSLAPLFMLGRAIRSQSSPVTRALMALRRSSLLGILAAVLMLLQFQRLLNLTTAILLVVVVLLLQVLLSLRRR